LSGEAEPRPGEALERAIQQANEPDGAGARPPPLRPFGLLLHHDGRWSHEGQPFTNQRLRELFDRSVRYLVEEGAYVVQVGRFRGLVEVEEAGFFVRSLDVEAGSAALSDGSSEALEVRSLRISTRDGALLCRVKRELVPEGLAARFSHSAQADFMNAVAESGDGVVLGGRRHPLPELVAERD
jgi:hypothetical protein